MKNFYLHNNSVEIVNNNGSISTIYFNENSGKVYFRYKIGTISQVKQNSEPIYLSSKNVIRTRLNSSSIAVGTRSK